MTLLLGIAVGGCGSDPNAPELIPVTGEAFFESEPAEGATVVLTPREDSETKTDDSETDPWEYGFPYGVVGADGSFVVSTEPRGEGAPTGEYDVVVTWMIPAPGSDPDNTEPEMIDKLKGKYANPKTTTLSASVKAPETVLPRIELGE